MARAITSTTPGSTSCRPEMLTDMVSGSRFGKLRAQIPACSNAAPTTHEPIGTISPLSSAESRNSSGGKRPRVGSSQRSNASTPQMRPLCRSTAG